jgi:hypothetical protein
MKQKWIYLITVFLLTACNTLPKQSTPKTEEQLKLSGDRLRGDISVSNTAKYNKKIISVYFMDLPGKRPSDNLADWKTFPAVYGSTSYFGGSGEPLSNGSDHDVFYNTTFNINRDWHLRWYIWENKYSDVFVGTETDPKVPVTMCEATTKVYVSDWFIQQEKGEGRDWHLSSYLGLHAVFFDDGQSYVLAVPFDVVSPTETDYAKDLYRHAQKGKCVTATPN